MDQGENSCSVELNLDQHDSVSNVRVLLYVVLASSRDVCERLHSQICTLVKRGDLQGVIRLAQTYQVCIKKEVEKLIHSRFKWENFVIP